MRVLKFVKGSSRAGEGPAVLALKLHAAASTGQARSQRLLRRGITEENSCSSQMERGAEVFFVKLRFAGRDNAELWQDSRHRHRREETEGDSAHGGAGCVASSWEGSNGLMSPSSLRMSQKVRAHAVALLT